MPPLQEGLNSFSIDVMGERRFFDERNSDGWEGLFFLKVRPWNGSFFFKMKYVQIFATLLG